MAVDDGFTDEQRNKLELLTEAFTTDEIKALANYDVEHVVEQTGMSRRQVLGIGAMLAGGAATGGYAVSELVDPAQAQADTGDSDGNVGLPTDRVDIFAEGLNLAGSDIYVQGTGPSSPSTGDIWIDNDG